jgi:hypothetical protein
MKKLEPHENEIVGEWIREGERVVGNDSCRRIQWLIAESLQQVGVDEKSGGWEKLFRDPGDGRYWLLSYPHGEMQGGGPPALRHLVLTDQEVKERFVSPDVWINRTEKLMRERNIRFLPPNDSAEAKD